MLENYKTVFGFHEHVLTKPCCLITKNKFNKEKSDQTVNKTLTRHIKVDKTLVFANFVFSRTLVHDRNAGVANVKPAHYLWVKTKNN